MPVSFDLSKEEFALVEKIVSRAETELGCAVQRRDLSMDLAACHANGTPLRLAALLAAPASDFAHDVTGITKYIDRTTGKLGNCFLPRYAEAG